MKRWLAILAALLCVGCASAASEGGGIDDDFGGGSPQWEITSGALTFNEGVARTDSPVFRMVSADRSYNDVIVTVTLAVDALHGGPDWSGAHIWVRYQSEYELYAVSVDREDGAMIIKKKCAGGPDPSNGGTYYNLTDYQNAGPIPYGHWQNVVVAVYDLPNGDVEIMANRDGHGLTAVDNGLGCRPLHNGGVGVRSDNAVLRIDRFVAQRS